MHPPFEKLQIDTVQRAGLAASSHEDLEFYVTSVASGEFLRL